MIARGLQEISHGQTFRNLCPMAAGEKGQDHKVFEVAVGSVMPDRRSAPGAQRKQEQGLLTSIPGTSEKEH